jgi:PST family polysaccharide transporter
MATEKTAPSKRKAPDYFEDLDISLNIKGRIVRGSAFLIAASGAQFVINIVSTIILARLLDPEAYGLLAMVFVMTNFLTLFRDMNLSLATVQKETITHAQISTIFWVNAAVSCAIALALLALAPAVSWFYSEPRLTLIAALLVVPVLIRGLVNQHKALLRRKMYFGTLTAIDLAGTLISYTTAVVMAWLGYGYWSLVWMRVVSALADFVMSWYATKWWPGLPVRGSGVRGMILFGTNLTAYSVIRYASRSLDNALIGWYSGAAALGIYSKSRDIAGQIISYVQSPFSAIGVPSLSRLTHQPDRYRRIFQRLTEKIVLIAIFAAILIGCTAEETIHILLGPKWVEAVPILTVLSVMIFIEAVYGCVNWLFISQGRGGQLFRYGVFDAVARVAAILIGFPWGVIGIALSLAIVAFFIKLPVQIWYVCRQGPVRQVDVYGMLAPLLAAGGAGLVAVLGVRSVYPVDNPAVAICIATAVLGLVMLCVLLITPSGRRALLDLVHGLEMLLPWRRRKA